MSRQSDHKGVVSVFLGITPSRDWLEQYLRETYDEGRSPEARCPFWDDLGVTWLDHDFQDSHYQDDGPVAVDGFLRNPFSYIDSFRHLVLAQCHELGMVLVNSGVLLYDFAYPSERAFPSPYLKFVGCFPYTVSSPGWFGQLLR